MKELIGGAIIVVLWFGGALYLTFRDVAVIEAHHEAERRNAE